MKQFIKNIMMKRHRQKFLKNKELNKAIQLKNDFLLLKRESLYKSKNVILGDVQKEVVSNLCKQGFSSNRLSEIYEKNEELIEYMKGLCEKTKGKSYKELVEEHNYSESKDYWVNLYHPQKGKLDPIKKFMSSPEVFTIAARYLGEIPQIAMLSLLYTPPTKEKYKNSMMWHLDNHHENIVRMFINPYDMTIENGATMIFPNKYQPVYDYYKRYPYFTDEEAKKFGFNFNDKIDLIGDSGHIYFADSAKCFHCGSRSKKDRFVAILTFVPYLHFNKYKDDFIESELNIYEEENQKILEYFKDVEK